MKKNRLTTLLFLTILYLITLVSLLKPDDIFSSKEKRYLAQKPEFSTERLLSGEYGTAYEEYLNDQFPLRQKLAALYTVCERLLGKTEIAGIYFGKSDYFIEHHEESIYTTELARKNEDIVIDFLTEMSAKLGSQRVRFLPAPSAETVLTAYLPDGAPAAEENELLDRYAKRLSERNLSEIYIPTVSAFQENQRTQQLYYRTDHHWTTAGAFAAYELWAKSMDITPLQRNDFTEVTLKDDFYGTVAARVNTQIRSDSLTAYLPLFPASYQVRYSEETTWSDSLYVSELLDSPEPYAVYLKGNQPLTRIRTTHAAEEMSGRKLLVIKDSFGNSLLPFLVNHYSETLVVDLRNFNQDLTELIDNEQITDVCVVQNPSQMSKEKSIYRMVYRPFPADEL